ncbi:MAG TPA: pilus assembly protein TadG-related protein [Bryobacteraceae bacterium]|nr:pilus assembly protein TadG-related protein [Bryobacteraceae bacterium]
MLVTMVVSLTVVMAFLGLAIDVGFEQYMKVRMQAAADAAALGGARELAASGGANLVPAARGDAATNGFTNGQNSVTVTVNNPPSSGYSTSNGTAVEVIITQTVPTFFMEIMGFSSGTVRARAVAQTVGGGATSCFYALDPTMSNAFSVSNGVNVSSSCGIMIDSNSNTALTATGGAHLSAPSISVVGRYTVNNGATISPNPTTGVASVSNPFSSLPTPSVGSCNYTNYTAGGGQTVTLNPGVYCGGINIANGVTATFNAGTYILKGGGFTLGGGARVSGSGVMFYNTYAAGYSYGPINFANGTTETFVAPTSGTYAGILFFQDPAVSGGTASSFAGGTNANLTGTLYFPTTSLSFSNGASAAYTVIVADSVSFTGGVTLNNNYTSLPGGVSPIKGGQALSE